MPGPLFPLRTRWLPLAAGRWDSTVVGATCEPMGMDKKQDRSTDSLPLSIPPINIDPLDDWLHVRPSVEDEGTGRLLLPATVQMNRLERVVVLGVGSEVADVVAGDLVLLLPGNAVELRDGTKLVQREYAIARVRD